MKDKLTDKEMIDPYKTETVTGQSMGDFGASGRSTGLSETSSDGTSIAAETKYFFAVCSGCSFRGEETTLRRIAQEEARQHMVDYPGHSVFVEEKAAPVS